MSEPRSGRERDRSQSTEYQALRAAALLACETRVEYLDLSDHTCEESLTEPFHDGSCLVEKELCGGSETGGGETGGGETGGTDAPGFELPASLVLCTGELCEVDESLIEQVLTADESTFAADGTFLIPHAGSSGMQDGWEFGGIEPGNLGDALGFQDGDVVTEVAGETVDSWTAVIDVANEALHADRVELVFVRDGWVHTRTYARQ